MGDYVRCLDCGQMVHNIARICPYCGGHPPTTRNGLELFFDSPPNVIAGTGIGLTLGLTIAAVSSDGVGRTILLSIVLPLLIGAIATCVLSECSEQTQRIWAFLAWLPAMLLFGGIFLYMGGAFLWVLWMS